MKKIFFVTFLCYSFFIQGEELPIIFHHIPKTAGTTVSTVLRKSIPNSKICPKVFHFEIDKVDTAYLSQFQLIWGHIFFSQLKDIKGRKITFLRDPVDLVISEHRFWVWRGRDRFLMNEHFLARYGDPLYIAANQMCKFLSSYDPKDPRIPMKMHLQSAMDNIKNNFLFVGIVEKMDLSMKILMEKLGLESLEKIPWANRVGDHNECFPKALIQQIEKRNWADRKLYEYGCKLFEERYQSSCVISFAR